MTRIATNEIVPTSRRLLALTTASGFAMSALLANPAMAQDAQQIEQAAENDTTGEDENVIVVSGFRASLESSQDFKKDADTVVDVITAEDIGALPDRSVAEALQRVPGVNIGRFENASDPDRFSVEGTGVIVRGLPFVRSELNGRDIFSATGGRVLSFNDVSPELLGRVEVFKNATSDMIDGGIAGTVNLVTRKPLDNPGFHFAGSIEGNYGDLAEEWSPGISVLGSTTFENNAGRIGVQLGYTTSELVSRTDASQITDPCYRSDTLDGGCFRVRPVSSAGVGEDTNFDASNFPPANSVVVPKGAGVRTTELTRDREAWSAVLQYEGPNEDFLVTFEWLRAEADFFTHENSLLALVNDDSLFPIQRAGSTWQFDSNGIFQSGILTQSNGDGFASPFGGVPLESLRFQRATESTTEDFSLDVDWEVSDRFRVNFEAQHIKSDLRRDSIIGAMNTWADIAIDNTGRTPQVEFISPEGAPDDYFSSGFYTYYWFMLDSLEENDGDLDSLRFDAEYDISDTGFFKSARFGARWADRERTNRNTNFSTWGNLSAPWTGRAGCAPWGGQAACMPGAPGTLAADPSWGQVGLTPGRLFTRLPDPNDVAVNAGGAFTDEFPGYSNYRNPFGDGFQRGNAPTPIVNGAAWFYGADDFLGEYLSGESARQATEINDFSQTPNRFIGVHGRTGCDPYCSGEISDVGEETKAAYARVDFGTDFSNGWTLEGNIGLRYIETSTRSNGAIGFPIAQTFDGNILGVPADGVVDIAEINQACAIVAPGQAQPGYCSLSDARKAEFAAAFTGDVILQDQSITYENWLPSLNAKLDIGDGLLFRLAVSKGISRPDLNLFGTGGSIGDNTNNLRDEGTLETGPLFVLNTGNRGLRPTESWNYDLSVEWYFDDVGSLTLAGFIKDIDGIVSNEQPIITLTGDNGTTATAQVNQPANLTSGTLKGVEIAYQQSYDFLPGLLSGLGSQLTYTYVDGGDFSNIDLDENQGPFAGSQPLAGISKHTFNATVFYEKGPFAARAAYNWRSDFLITPRDSIFPFSPIWQESSGQLDASIFYSITDDIKVGVQGVNLLDTVTQTSQVVDFDGNRITRSAFRNDRRYTFIARFDF